MKINKLSIVFLVIAITMFAQSGCTSNPVVDDKISSGQRQITGNVQLDSENRPERVFVWLDGFDIGTYTNNEGNFSLTLSAGQNEGVTGIFKLFFFVANYELDYENIAVRNGSFLFGQEGLDSQGRLRESKRLELFLIINTMVEPASIKFGSVDNIDISLVLQTNPAVSDTATVVFPKTTAGILGPVFFQNIDTDELFVFETLAVETQEMVIVGANPIERSASLKFFTLNLPTAKYAVFPFLHMAHQEIPAQLLNRIGPNFRELGLSYLRIPFSRKDGYLEVLPAG